MVEYPALLFLQFQWIHSAILTYMQVAIVHTLAIIHQIFLIQPNFNCTKS